MPKVKVALGKRIVAFPLGEGLEYFFTYNFIHTTLIEIQPQKFLHMHTSVWKQILAWALGNNVFVTLLAPQKNPKTNEIIKSLTEKKQC